MDTKKDSAAADIPTFKVARVGEDRKRRGGGFSFLRGGGSRGAWSGATGGSGAGAGFGGIGGFGGAGAAGFGEAGGVMGLLSRLAGGLGMSFGKAMLVIMLTSAIGSAAIYYGSHGGMGSASDAKKPAIFSGKDVKLDGNASNLPSNANTIPNSLGYLTGSLDGLTPEERAKKAADAAAAAAAAEAARVAEEEAAKKAEANAMAGSAVNPAAMMAAAQAGAPQGPRPSAFGHSIGGLSSLPSGGQSLTGGAGMSGGMNRQFGAGVGGLNKGAGGQMSKSGASARPTYARAAGSSRAPKSNVKGFARKQLAAANLLSQRGASAGKGETAATDAGSAFDNNKGAGNAISGPGIGSAPGASNGTYSAPTPNPGGGDPGGTTGCAATGTCVVDCKAHEAVDENGVCQPIAKNEGKNVTSYQWMYNVARGLLLTVTALSVLAMIFDKSMIFKAHAAVLRGIIMVLGGIIASFGAAIILMTGDKLAGGILAAAGAGILITAMMIKTNAITGNLIRKMFLGPLISSVVGGFATSMARQPAAAAQ